MWEKTGQTKAPLSMVIEYFMNPENEMKYHPKVAKGIENIRKEGDAVTWDQRLAVMGMNFRSVVESSLDRATNSIETKSISGAGRGTTMTRTMKEIPAGTEVHWTYDLKLGPLRRLFLGGRAKRVFEAMIDEDLKALDGLA